MPAPAVRSHIIYKIIKSAAFAAGSETMNYFAILLPLGLILILSKLFSKICQRVGLPAVIGMLAAGLLIGCLRYIPGQDILTAETIGGLGFLAKIGVVLIMFSAGLETDIKQIRSVGFPVIVITLFGVFVPMGLGFLSAALFHGGFSGVDRLTLLSDVFYGVILTATSVSVTVATLRDLGCINSRAGTTVVAAAILDDIVGVVVLSVVAAMKGGEGSPDSADGSPVMVILRTLLFFVFVAVVGMLANKFFYYLDRKFPHHRLMAVFSLGFCFLLAYISERCFGVADITGAFAAGLFLSRNPDAKYIDGKSDAMGYLIFTPVFFCNIGITTEFGHVDGSVVLFGLCFILAGILGKFLGCALSSRIFGYSMRESCAVGVGMMARAEVALVCVQKGIEYGLVAETILPFVVILIVLTSFLTPILLKKICRGADFSVTAPTA